jgi:hypothetical protein
MTDWLDQPMIALHFEIDRASLAQRGLDIVVSVDGTWVVDAACATRSTSW